MAYCSFPPGVGFKKGQSGNPGGRPAGLKKIRERALALSDEALSFLERVLKDEGEKIQYRIAAASMILDRGLGKPMQALQLANNDEIDVTPRNMTGEQLKKQIEEFERELKEDAERDKAVKDGINLIEGKSEMIKEIKYE
jgi:hypothetical protein